MMRRLFIKLTETFHSFGDRQVLISVDQIIRVEDNGPKCVRVHFTKGSSSTFAVSLRAFEEMLTPQAYLPLPAPVCTCDGSRPGMLCCRVHSPENASAGCCPRHPLPST